MRVRGKAAMVEELGALLGSLIKVQHAVDAGRWREAEVELIEMQERLVECEVFASRQASKQEG